MLFKFLIGFSMLAHFFATEALACDEALSKDRKLKYETYLVINGVENRKFFPEDAMGCYSIRRDKNVMPKCSACYADDSAHTMEFPPYQILHIEPSSKLALKSSPKVSLKIVEAYEILTKNHHAEDQGIKKLEITDPHDVPFQSIQDSETHSLVVFGKQKNGELVRLHWLINPLKSQK